MVKYIDWDTKKNEQLIKTRGISFEEVLDVMFEDGLIKTERHPNWKKYPTQHIFIVEIRKYAYIVPFVEDAEKYFLKRLFRVGKRLNNTYKQRKEKYES